MFQLESSCVDAVIFSPLPVLVNTVLANMCLLSLAPAHEQQVNIQ